MIKNDKKLKPPSLIDETLTKKLVSDANTEYRENRLNGVDLSSISSFSGSKVKSNRAIMELFPDIELSIQIITSSIMSPNDLFTTSLNYKAENSFLPSEVKATLLNTIKENINTDYDLENKLSTIIEESLFTKGAYSEVYIPESSIDKIINGEGQTTSLEEFNGDLENFSIALEDSVNLKNNFIENKIESIDSDVPNDFKNYLKDKEINIDDFILDIDKLIGITDNNAILRSQELYKKIISTKTKKSLSIGLEANDSFDIFVNKKLSDIFKPIPFTEIKEVVTVTTDKENINRSVGKPLVMKIPVESIIPIHMTGDVTKHIGYFVLLDEKGNPITETSPWSISAVEELNLMLQSGGIAKRAKDSLSDMTKETPILENMDEIYAELIDRKIEKIMKTSRIFSMGEMGDISHLYKVMLSRVLAKQQTRMLFIPEEIMTYYAFNFRENGTGESLLEKVNVLASIRAILLFARLMANIKNSITNTKVTAKLSEDDPDPNKTIDSIISHAMKTRQTQLPVGVTKVGELVDWAHKVGFSFNFEHPSLPDMEVETEERNSSFTEPEGTLEEHIQKQIIQSFGLTPEIVDSGLNNADFAATVIANNALLAKRIYKLQNTLCKNIDSNIIKIISNDFKIRKKLLSVIKANFNKIIKNIKKDIDKTVIESVGKDYVSDWILDEFVKSIRTSLPRPIISDGKDNLSGLFRDYKDSVEEMMDVFFSPEAMPEELTGDFTNELDSFKSAAVNTLVRKWMADNNYLPDMQKILMTDEDGNPSLSILEEYNDFLTKMEKAVIPFIEANKKHKEKFNNDLDKLDQEVEESEEEEVTDNESNDDQSTEPDDTSDENNEDENNEDIDNI